ncbi:fimbrial protein [Kluyvera sp. STS39-E]|uniref:fimbrial protein n=1 Tax=Kluyvera sp. STS39-E TaxID=3234748 RepID=UPI0034C6B859
MKLKVTFFALLFISSQHAFAADIPAATMAGNITMKGNIYSAACTISSGAALTLKIANTYANAYAKGDASPLSTSAQATFTCPNNTGVNIRVDGVADTTEPSLYQVTPGTGKATGVAIRITASSGTGGTVSNIPLVPNTVTSEVFTPSSTGTNLVGINFKAQLVAVSDTVTSGDLSTALTWTAIYN